MIDITVTAEQADAIRSAPEPVVLRGPAGDLVEVVDLPNSAIVKNEAEILAAIEERHRQPHRWFTTAEVLSHLMEMEQPN